jgi:alpha-L-fucosidase
MTMNNLWGYNKHDQHWKSTQTLVRNLVDCASKGGNYLLNVGPTSEGLIPGPSIERLAEIGKWMKANSEAIYGTSASPFKRLPWGRCTKKVQGDTTTLYLHVFNWPADGKLVVPGLKNDLKKAWLLTDKKRKPLAVSAHAEGPVIAVPAQAPDAVASVIVAQIKGEPDVAPALVVQETDGAVKFAAAEANLHGQVQYESDHNKRCIGFWMDSDDHVDWDFRLARPGKFTVVVETATQDEGVALTVGAGSAQVRIAVPRTGDYTKFQKTEIGTLDIPAGTAKLVVKPVKEGWKPVNLRSVLLKPAN